MTGDFPLLVAAIRENPDDDTPRLVAADWLDEHGQPDRAELIRCQIELARAPRQVCTCTLLSRVFGRCAGCKSNVGLDRLRQREQDLLTEHGVAWVSEIPGAADYLHPTDTCRGFWDSITTPGDWWVQHADAVLADHPIRRVRFATMPHVTRREDRPFYWFSKRPAMRMIPAGNNPDPVDLVCRLLGAEWPGLAFEVPNGTVPLNLMPEQTDELNRQLSQRPPASAPDFLQALLPLLTPAQVDGLRQFFEGGDENRPPQS